MQLDESAYFMKNGTELPARPVNVLFDVAILRGDFSVVVSLWLHTRGSNNEFRPHELVTRPGTLELTFRESKEVEECFNLHASSPSTCRWFLEDGMLIYSAGIDLVSFSRASIVQLVVSWQSLMASHRGHETPEFPSRRLWYCSHIVDTSHEPYSTLIS